MGREASIADNTLKIKSTIVTTFAMSMSRLTLPKPYSIARNQALQLPSAYTNISDTSRVIFPPESSLRSRDHHLWLGMSSWLRCAGLLRGCQSENHLSFRLDVFGGEYDERSTSN